MFGPQLPPPIHAGHHQHPAETHVVAPIVPPHIHEPHQLPHNHHAEHPIIEAQHDHPIPYHRQPSPIVHQLPIHEAHHEHYYHHHPIHIHPDYQTHPKYDFGYNIFDPHTGDIKNQYEYRNGDFVRGTYSFIEADGQRRIVEYSSDPLTGFNALVRHEPLGHGHGHF